MRTMFSAAFERACAAGAFLTAFGTAASALAAPPAPPAYDHIVVVVEENESFGNVVGSPSAPYINNTLIPGGVSFNNFFALTHPSQPNYLQMFSGSNQGNTDDAVPAGRPFTTPNLAAALGANKFVGYSEDLPSVGSQAATSGLYARKHVPWANWQGAGTNQLPATDSRPFFPYNGSNQPITTKPFFGELGDKNDAGGLDFTKLPKMSFVIPNLVNDMHDGSYPTNVQAGDTWLQQHLASYATWAKTHNSLLIVTFDEDNGSAQANKIPTVLYGANLRDGSTISTTYTLHNLLRTLEDSAGASYHSGRANNVKPIVGPFAGQTPGTVVSFQQGVGGYSGAKDTLIREDQPTTAGGALMTLIVDGDLGTVTGSARQAQALMKFDNLVGNGAGQVPAGAVLLSAKLLLKGSNSTVDDVRVYRMRQAWNDQTATWDSFTGGITANGSEAELVYDFLAESPQADNTIAFDVTDTLQSWVNGTSTNFGWVLLPTGTDGYQFTSAEGTLADRPILEITLVPEPATAAGLGGTLLTGMSLRRPRRSRPA
jgi:phosphatidylinositol-3-phosphatase